MRNAFFPGKSSPVATDAAVWIEPSLLIAFPPGTQFVIDLDPNLPPEIPPYGLVSIILPGQETAMAFDGMFLDKFQSLGRQAGWIERAYRFVRP